MEMTITNAQYVELHGIQEGVRCTIDGVELFVPLESDNRHYAEILKQVAAGTLTIADAD